jgi:hypothetical protein
MLSLTALTLARYLEIVDFKKSSEEFVFVVEGDASRISKLKTNIQNLTYQTVQEEMIEEGVYRLRVRCPPDKINSVWALLGRLSRKEEKEK